MGIYLYYLSFKTARTFGGTWSNTEMSIISDFRNAAIYRASRCSKLALGANPVLPERSKELFGFWPLLFFLQNVLVNKSVFI